MPQRAYFTVYIPLRTTTIVYIAPTLIYLHNTPHYTLVHTYVIIKKEKNKRIEEKKGKEKGKRKKERKGNRGGKKGTRAHISACKGARELASLVPLIAVQLATGQP